MPDLGGIEFEDLTARVGARRGSVFGETTSSEQFTCYGAGHGGDIVVAGEPPVDNILVCRTLDTEQYFLAVSFVSEFPEFHPKEAVFFNANDITIKKLVSDRVLAPFGELGYFGETSDFYFPCPESQELFDYLNIGTTVHREPLKCAFSILDNPILKANQKTFDEFLTYIRNEVINCPTPLISLYTNRAVREFCRQTLVWREDLFALDVVEDQKDYHLVFPDGAQLVVPLSVEVDGRRIEPMAEDSHRRNSEFNSYSYEVRNEILHLNFKPERDAAGGLCVRVALMPKEGTQKAHKIIVDKYRYEIASGVKSELMMMKDKNWSNASQGMYYAKEFHSAMSKTRFEAGMGHTRSNLRVRMIPAA